MISKNNNIFYHLVAFITVAIWGTTFVSTKVLMLNGLSPAQIFTLRFSIAYVLMLAFNHRRPFADSWLDEAKMALLGITGGSLYFLSENEAMNYTTTTNISLIVCLCPLFATLLVRLAYKDSARIHIVQLLGSLLAFAGMIIVVLNGRFVLHLSPVGDALAFTACMCWAIYSLLMKSVTGDYSAAFITRKVFFYGVLTILPYYLVIPGFPSLDTLVRPQVVGNLLFLGCLASMVCFLTWNWCISKLGTVKATNWVYFNPITTMIFASWVLGEKITPYFLAGAACILLGMYVADKKTTGEKSSDGILALLALALPLFFSSCSKEKVEDDTWYKPIDEFVATHTAMMQNNPDSMIRLVRQLPYGENPKLTEQWKRLIIAKCHFLKGADDECQSLIDSVNAYCRQHPGEQSTFKIQSYADNMHGILMLTVGKRDSAYAYYTKAYRELMKLSNHHDAIDICINAADASRQMGKLADASSWYRRANFLADSLQIEDAQNSILAGLGQVYNDLQNYQLAHYYFSKAERLYPPKTPKDVHFFYNSWGNVYSSQGKSAEALKCFLKAQKACQQVGQPFMTAIVNANLGQTYLELNQLDSAQKYLALTTKFFELYGCKM